MRIVIPEKRRATLDIETTGLNPLSDQITCIGIRTDKADEYVLSGEDERQLLERLLDKIITVQVDPQHFYLLTKNGKKFDLPFLLVRAAKHDLCMNILFDFQHIDVHDMTYRWISLDDFATILNTPNKSGSGKKAIELFRQKRFAELEKYCMNDCKVLDAVFDKLIELHEVIRQ
jgi:DNA polymerase elongation subunit (family B)